MRPHLRGLYVITDHSHPGGRSHLQIAEAALKGGARIIQFRDKSTSTREAIRIAHDLRRLTRCYNALLFVNDCCDITAAINADGVHLGNDDMPIEAARKILGSNTLIGISVDTPEEAETVARAGADYVSLGPIFPTTTKRDAGPVVGLDVLRETRARVSLPLAAIGGINLTNAASVVHAGADMVCVISAVAAATNMTEATRQLVESLRPLSDS